MQGLVSNGQQEKKVTSLHSHSIRCNRMFLFMYCNNHFPVNLKEQTLFEVTVPTSVYYQSKLSQKISFFAVGK